MRWSCSIICGKFSKNVHCLRGNSYECVCKAAFARNRPHRCVSYIPGAWEWDRGSGPLASIQGNPHCEVKQKVCGGYYWASLTCMRTRIPHVQKTVPADHIITSPSVRPRQNIRVAEFCVVRIPVWEVCGRTLTSPIVAVYGSYAYTAGWRAS